MIFFTADTHFGHANILKLCGRPFDTIEEMNEKMIGNWNDRVKGTDTVYIVGDMFFRCSDAETILNWQHGSFAKYLQLLRQSVRSLSEHV